MKIGLLVDLSENNQILVNYPYYTFAEKYGNVTVVTPFDAEVKKDLDLLILIGGADVHPYRYGQPKIPWLTQNQNTNLEYFDTTLLPKYIKEQIPIFGVCRGAQTLNVHFGGSLNQHVDEPNSGMDRGKLVHQVRDVRTGHVYLVNSLHHQSIDKLGYGIEVALQGFIKQKKKAYKELCIEAIRHIELPIAATQFHPEELDDDCEEAIQTISWVDDEIARIIQMGQNIKQQKEEQLLEANLLAGAQI